MKRNWLKIWCMLSVLTLGVFHAGFAESSLSVKETNYKFKTKLGYNIYGPNYQGYGPKIGKENRIQKGDELIIEITGISNKDIPCMYFGIVDLSDSASWWRDITSKGEFYIKDIVANEPFHITFSMDAIASPNSMNSTKFVFMHEDKKIKTVRLTSCEIKLTRKRKGE